MRRGEEIGSKGEEKERKRGKEMERKGEDGKERERTGRKGRGREGVGEDGKEMTRWRGREGEQGEG